MADLGASFWVPTILAATGTAATVYSQVQQGKAIKQQAKAAEKQEAIDARSREITRKKRLLANLASQNVSAGAGGVRAFEGSAGNIAQRTMADAGLEQLADSVGSFNRRQSLSTQGSNAEKFANLSAGLSLIEGAQTIAEIGLPAKKPTKKTDTSTK